ncbi:MAG: alpha-N-arabinofuranosidase [Planctomycetaceae bacterium]|nr:alpha-N-arabinofuranosidase [Planctomycetaceae bacterium]
MAARTIGTTGLRSIVVLLAFGASLVVSTSDTDAAERTEASQRDTIVVHADQDAQTINRNIYGHFSEHLGRCIYEGFWVGPDSHIPNTRGIRNDVVAAMRKIKPPVLRWPGGCFADEYHWRDGIGPREHRPSMVNNNWGGVTENNHFGTHEFFDLCDQLGCEPYICGNVGSGTVQEMQQWIEYITQAGHSPMADLRRANGRQQPWKLTYFGVGNECWGCGGNMTPEYYADQYRRYSTFVRSSSPVFKIACGPCADDYHWTEVLMRQCGGNMDGLSLHYYCGTGNKSRSATRFDEDDWFHLLQRALRMEELVAKHASVMDKHDPQKRVALVVDEWGTWHDVEPGTNPGFLYQQNTLRDALVAAVSLNILNRHCDRVRMANIAQAVNVLQSMILTDKEKMIVTPTYHVFEMYAVHQDAALLPTDVNCADYRFGSEKIPGISVSASRDKAGKIHVTLCNLSTTRSTDATCQLRGIKPRRVSGRVLTSPQMTDHNTFSDPEKVKPASFDGSQVTGAGFRVSLPAKSVVVLEVE